ncbi:mediator of RNA polymerase II transcription subunit 33A isoform X2 [Eucalyptus grandis]|uniref:mediator of RNA polymerase II transcription subunit 33A isoform X2 n=1 Tax=Eucalyptus grandis TaxID=71139 RepID=UPI00192E7E9A|nr:mediator of RNA polymerase II transcription subunit 33A isoform X2 [Eucalyptus grandis]
MHRLAHLPPHLPTPSPPPTRHSPASAATGGAMGSDGGGAEAAEVEGLVSEAMKRCQARGEAPAAWSAEVARCVVSRGLELPSAELGQAVVARLSSGFGEPSLWKFLDHAMASRLISSLHALCLLTPRVLSCRQAQPEAYRLYLDLLARYTFSPEDFPSKASRDKIVRAIDADLQFSRIYGINVRELGHTLVIFFFNAIVSLIDSTMDDWGLQIASMGGLCGSFESMEHHQRNVGIRGSEDNKRSGHREYIRNMNSLIAMEVLENLTRSRKALALLRLIHMNMPDKFNGLLQRLQFLETYKLPSPNLISAKEVLARLSSNIHKVLAFESDLKRSFIGMFLNIRSIKSVPYSDSGSALSACWAPFDIYVETAMDGRLLPVTSASAILTELIFSLQALNRASWQDTFLALWLSALRLVQRERDPPEGPVPHLEARLCILLCIVPLAITGVLMNDVDLSSTSSCDLSASILSDPGHGHKIDEKVHGLMRNGLISSLQLLGQFSGLLHPPELVQDAANSAAAKAANASSKQMRGNDSIGVGDHDVLVKCGNMRHLIVEACIARRLVDTSAYFWPGYVLTSVLSIPDSSMKEMSPWSVFMEGGALTASLVSSLVATPATSLAETEKLYNVALNGSNEEKSAAATIMCGASLSRGWNIQEHVVKFVVKLLSPPVPSGHNGPHSHFVDYMPMLSALLFGASSIDTVHILSLHGVVPEVAAALMPLCELYGSLNPLSSSGSRTSEEPSVYMVFSAAFLFLLRLWKFYKPPVEIGAIGADLTLEFLMLLHNSRKSLASHDSSPQNEVNSSMNQTFSMSDEPEYIDNYPRLRAWYCQNKICIASPLSGLCSGSPVHQVANKILSMIYSKMTRSTSSSGNSSTTPPNSGLGGSPTSAGEEPHQRPVLCAWEVLEAIPFVLEAILSACTYGRLSSRDLTTGLRDLIDFLPASLATIISYFSAEVTRGIWGPVPMNGIDWPSPTQAIQSVESEIKEILAAAGVNTPSYPPGVEPMLPLPMAALVSLTITFKLDKSLEYILAVAGPAMEDCASYCPWPSMPIIGSLWAQKVRRWHNFIVVSCSRSVFRQNKEALAQLIRSCFTSFLGPLDDLNRLLTNQPCLNGLLGNKISALGVPPSIAPGFLFLRSSRFIQDKEYLSDTIIKLVVEYGSKLATRCPETSSARLKSGQASLSLASARIKEVGLLGASLLCSAGGLYSAQELLRETIPTWLLTTREETHGEGGSVSRMFEGYALAYLVYLTGTFACGIRARAAPWAYSRRPQIIGMHMDFLAGVLGGNMSIGCGPVMWKAYVSCLVGLVVSFAPAWVREVKHETLARLARGLWGWHECELALSLLERGGFATMGPLAEFFSVMD